jgi:hypothetical protein
MEYAIKNDYVHFQETTKHFTQSLCISKQLSHLWSAIGCR